VPDIVPSLGSESSIVPVAWVKSCFLGPGEGERQSMLAGWALGKKLDGGGVDEVCSRLLSRACVCMG